MDIVVTGSNGLIGSALTRALEREGHRVLRLVRPGGRADGDTAVWDPAAGSIDAAALEGTDAVIHLAGEGIAEKRWTAQQKEVLVSSRVQGTSLLATALAGLQRPPKRLLSGSAIGIYGDTGSTPTDESGPEADDFLADLCRRWEAAAQPARDAGIAVIALRTGVVLTPRGGALQRQLPFFKLGLGGRSGSGRQYLSWISLDDEIAAIRHLLDASLEGPVNLTAPEPVTNAEFARSLGRALRRPTTIIPMFGPRLLVGRELADSLLLVSQRVVPRRLSEDGFEFRHRTLDDALADLLR